jgi:hypothetical protein
MSPGGKDPESARSAEQIDIKRLPIKIQKVLNKYDVDGDGTITAAEFVIAMEQHEATRDSLKRQKRIVFWTFAVIIPVLLVFVAVGFGVVYWAVEYAKEARVSDETAVFTSASNGQPVGTANVYYRALSSEDINDAALKDIREVSFALAGMPVFAYVDSIVRLPINPTNPDHEFLTRGPLAIFTADAYIVVTDKLVEVEEGSELITKVMKVRGLNHHSGILRRQLLQSVNDDYDFFYTESEDGGYDYRFTMYGTYEQDQGNGKDPLLCSYKYDITESCAASSPSPSPLSPPYPPPSPPTPPPPPQEKYCISPYMNIDICTCANTTGIHSVDQVDGTNGGNCQCNVTNIETYCDYTVDDRFVCDTNVDEVTLITSVSGASDQRQSTSMLNSYPATMKIAERFKKNFLRKNRKEYDKEYKGATKKLLSHDSNELEINCVDDALRLGISSIKCETTNPNTCKIMFEVDLHVIMYRLFEEFLEVQDKDSSVGFLNKRRLLQNDESCGDDMLCGDDGRLIELCQIEGNNLIFPGTFIDLSSCICDADQDCKCKFTVPDFLVNTPIQNRLNDALLKQDFDDFFGENDFIDTMPRYLYDFMPDNREVLFSNTRTCLADDANNEDFDSLHQVKTLNSCTCTNGDSAGSICTCDVPNIKDNIQLDTSEELPEGAILCPGFLTGQYCDCSGDCTNSEAWCSCDAAKAQTCCNTSR